VSSIEGRHSVPSALAPHPLNVGLLMNGGLSAAGRGGVVRCSAGPRKTKLTLRMESPAGHAGVHETEDCAHSSDR
jgi:hypothetical protein